MMRILLLLCLLQVSLSTHGVEEIQLRMAGLAGADLQGRGLVLDLVYNEDSSVSLAAQLEKLFAGGIELEGVRLDCVAASVTTEIECQKGSFSVARSPLGTLKSSLVLQYRTPDDWRLSLDSLQILGGKVRIQAVQQPAELVIEFDIRAVSLGWLKPWLPEGWSIAGSFSGSGRIGLQASRLLLIRLKGKLEALSWSSADGLQVGEDVVLGFSLDADRTAGAWKGNLDAQAMQGQLYSDPLFVELDARNPLELSGNYELASDGRYLRTRGLHLRYARALEISGELEAELSPGFRIQDFHLDFILADLQQAYQVLLQPLLIGTPMDELSLQGRVQGRLGMKSGVLQNVKADLDGMELEHKDGMFGITGLQANLDWRRQGNAEFSHLSWHAAHLYKITLGAADALLQLNAGSLRLQPLSIPLLGGGLMLHDLEVDGLLQGTPTWETRADLDEIQLLELSRSMGWPDMRGSLQASIPRVYYEDSVLRMQGQLKLDVFSGEVVMDGMQLQEPLGVAPVLQTSLSFSDLDLEQITQVFSFGRIEGSLEGYVRNLQLVAWEIAGFDASLHSPPGDKRPHRISQRAIDNLTELGNGASVQLSTTMLRFFEDFAYESLALQVKLEGTIAELDGVPRPQGGYYIVKGARLPRIDVIGRNHRIAWKELLSRIRDIRFDDMIVE
jgi:hypothetical protein